MLILGSIARKERVRDEIRAFPGTGGLKWLGRAE